MNFFKNLTLNKLFLLIIALSLAITIALVRFQILPSVASSVDKFQQKSSQREIHLTKLILENYLHKFTDDLNELSTLPVIVNGLMETSSNQYEFYEFLRTFNLSQDTHSFELIDVANRTIFSRNPLENEIAATESHWRLEMLQGSRDHYIGLSTANELPILTVAVPITYYQSVEGLLIGKIELHWPDFLGEMQVTKTDGLPTRILEIRKGNALISSAKQYSKAAFTLVSETLHNKQLTLDYYINKNELEKQKATFFNEIITAVTLTLIVIYCIIIGFSKKFIVNPFIKLQQSEANLKLLEQVVSNSKDGLIITKSLQESAADGPEIIYVNNAFSAITGYEKEELIGKTPKILQGDHTDKESLQKISLALQEQNSFKGELLNYSKSGAPYWIEISIFPIFTSGKLTHFAAFERDITERREDEEKLQNFAFEMEWKNMQLEEAQLEAVSASKKKSEFLAVMSHEIRTPMNGVIGMTSLLLESNLNKEQLRLANMVKTSAESLLHIINDILDFSKIESGKLELDTIDFNLYDLLNEIISIFQISNEDSSVAISLRTDDCKKWQVHADNLRLRQIITNLLSNAVKFTHQGSIVLSVTSDNCSSDSICNFCFSVTDTGIGIAAEKIDNLFDSFTQADSSTSREYGGTGLGLTICKRLVEIMGGKISVSSELNVGSTFSFHIPLPCLSCKENVSGQTPAAKENDNALFQNWNILIVDDNSVNCDYLSMVLQRLACQYTVAHNGEEAIECYQNQVFDLIFMDVQMPVMNGLQATATIREIEKQLDKNRITIVALTAGVMQNEQEQCYDVGMDQILTKPFTPTQIDEVLKKSLHKSTSSAVATGEEKQASKQPAASSMNSSTIDEQIFSEYQQICQDKTALMIESYLQQATSIVKSIEHALQQQDYSEISKLCHKLKSSSAMIGAVQLQKNLITLEEKAKGNHPISEEDVINLTDLFTKTRNDLQQCQQTL